MAEALFHLYFLWVVKQDITEMQVVRYSHLLGSLSLVLLAVRKFYDISQYFEEYMIYLFLMLMFQFIQYKLRCYGLADAVVLFLCGSFFLFKRGRQACLLLYFLLQAVSGIFFLICQYAKGNVGGLGVKHAAPYIPYIYVAFILTNVVLWKYI